MAATTTHLTSAQRAALEVLAAVHPKRVRGGKRSSDIGPPPRVNSVAALALGRRRLVQLHLLPWHTSAFSSAYEFSILSAGIEALHHPRQP